MDFKDKKSWQKWDGTQNGMSDGLLKKLWESSSNYKRDYQPDVEAGLSAFQQRMAAASGKTKVVQMRPPIGRLLKIAAGFAVLAIAVIVFKNYIGRTDSLQVFAAPTDATLEHKLPDGSLLELNRTSELVYSPDFTGKERRVKLSGEAFFDVQRDENRPFIIEVGDAKVTVLGTSFNVRAYPNEAVIEVFVASGKVRVDFGSGQSKELNKGEFLKFDTKASKILIGMDKTGVPAAWHTGVLNFKGQPIPMVLEGMERLFGVSFDLKTKQPTDCLQTLTVQEGELEEAIAALKLSCPKMRFEKNEDGGYIVNGACCE